MKKPPQIIVATPPVIVLNSFYPRKHTKLAWENKSMFLRQLNLDYDWLLILFLLSIAYLLK